MKGKIMTEQQIPKLVGKLVEHQSLFDGLSTEEAQWVIMKTSDAIGVMVKGVKEAFLNMMVFIKAILTITLKVVGKKLTKDCFVEEVRYYYRDPNLDLWFPKESEGKEAKATVWQLLKELTFIEMAQSLLKTKEGDIKKLSNLLKEAGHIFTLPEIEVLIERQESGEDVGLLTNGYANLFFVEDNDGNVSVVIAARDVRQWDVRAYRLDDPVRWSAGRRLFSRN